MKQGKCSQAAFMRRNPIALRLYRRAEQRHGDLGCFQGHLSFRPWRSGTNAAFEYEALEEPPTTM